MASTPIPMSKPAAAAATRAAAPPLRLMPVKQQQSDTRSLVVHGAPKTGKTSLLNALVNAGLEVHHLDSDSNNLSLTCGEAPNYFYYPVRNSTANNVWAFFKALRETNRVQACHAHATAGCAQCRSDGLPFYGLDLLSLPPRAIVVMDSFTSYYRAVQDAVVAKNGKDNLCIEDSDMGYYRTLGSAAAPVWHMMLKLPGAADSLVLTHQKDRQTLLTANPKSQGHVPSFKYPLSGSGSHSLDISSLSPASAVWATAEEADAAKRRFITKSNAKCYAFSPEEFGSFADMTPPEAIVEFYKRGRS